MSGARACDVLVIGLGPAGSSAAAAAARAGCSVLAIERKKVVGLPVQCAEFIPLPLGRYADEGTREQPIAGMATFLPSGERTERAFGGLMIRRDKFDQALARELAGRSGGLLLVAGRYEGIDERVRSLVDQEISIGDYVLSGGEIPAMVVIETVGRLVPGVLGNPDSLSEESFAEGTLEYPQYTRPEEFRGMRVPEILLSGDHGKIRAWRREESRRRTARRRPDLSPRRKP